MTYSNKHASDQLNYFLEKVKENDSLFHESNKIAQLGSYIFDIPNNRWYSNEVLNELLGIPENYEKTFETFLDLVHPDFKEKFVSYFKSNVLINHEPFKMEYMVVKPGLKEVVWVLGMGEIKYDDENNPTLLIGTIQNINKRKLAEAEVLKERNQFQQYLKVAGVLIAVLDKDLNLLKINDKGCQILGYSEGEIIGKNWVDNFIQEGEKDEIRSVLEKLIKGEIENQEYRENQILTKKGEIKTIAFHNSILCEENGLATGIMFSGEDITEHIIMEEELKNIFNLSPDMVCIADLNTLTFKKINPAFKSILGYSKDEIIGKSFLEFIHPDDLEKTKSIISGSLMKGEKVLGFENRYVAKDGSVKWLEWVSHPIPEKGIAYEIAHDVSNRKENEKALITSENRFKFALKDSNITVSNQDKDLKFIWYYNPSSGLSAENILGKTDFDIYLEEEAIMLSKLKNKVLKSGKSETAIVPLHINRNKTYSQISIEPLYDEAGTIIGISTISADITDLENAKQKAQESDKLKSAFLTNLSHEIRTPMNGIVGFSQLMNEPDTSEDKRTQYAKIINESGKQLLNIINDIIDISKIESGQIDINLHKVSLNQMLYELHGFYKPMLAQKDVDLFMIKGFSDKESVIISDGTKLQQILNNLIGNAYKFTSQGYIEFGYYLKGKFIEFYVKDTGMGIMPEFQDKIFERFSQEKSGWEQKQSGTGLGLSISKAYAELMGGKIWLKSKHGAGTTFYFTIPFKPTSATQTLEQQHDESKRELDMANKTILIAEDNAMNYMLLEEFLMTTKAKLIHAENGQEAVEFCKKVSKIDIILMDIKMPVMDGYEAIKQIKHFKPDIPIIAQSAFAMLEDEKKAIDTGADDYISKPIKGSLLFSKMKALLFDGGETN